MPNLERVSIHTDQRTRDQVIIDFMFNVLRSVTPASTATGVTTVMEDENGNVVLLQLFNQDEHRDGNAIIGEGMVVIVKEPYSKVVGDGKDLIHVDHVCDSVLLPEGNERDAD